MRWISLLLWIALCLAVAAWLVWQSAPPPLRTPGLLLFLLQLALNFAWVTFAGILNALFWRLN